MYANSIHLIDYFDLFCRGSVNKVISFKSERKNPSLVISKIQFNSGDIGIYYATWNRYSRWKIKITVNNKIEWVMQPLESLRCYSVSNNKLLFSRSYHSNYKDGLINMIKDVKKAFFNKKNRLVGLKKHTNTINLINKIYGK